MRRIASFLTRWLPPIVWIVVVLGFSSDAFSASQTSRIIVPLLKWLLPDSSPHTIELLHGVTRKIAHLGEYAILAALLFRGFKIGSHERWRRRWAAQALLIVLVCAGVDEYRQSLSAARTGLVSDVVIDLTGATAALGLIRFFHRPNREKRRTTNQRAVVQRPRR